MRTKQVDYAYGTSATANKHGKPYGCWLVETGEGAHLPLVDREESVHDTEREAIDAAHALDLPWSGAWLACQDRPTKV